MEEADQEYPVKGLADEELKSKLKARHRISQGTSNANCYIRNGCVVVEPRRDGELSPDLGPCSSPPETLSPREPEAVVPSPCGVEPSGDARVASSCSTARARNVEPPEASAQSPHDAVLGGDAAARPSNGAGLPPLRGAGLRNSIEALSAQGDEPCIEAAVTSGPELMQVLSPTTASPREDITEDAAVDEGDGLQYEWQFDILSSLPREKAIALVEHLRSSERERAKAIATALRLQRSNSSLERQLDGAVALLREADPSNPRLDALLAADCNGHDAPLDGQIASTGWWGQRVWRCLVGLLAVAVLLMPSAAFFLLASAPVIPPLDARWPRTDGALAPFPDVAELSLARRGEEERGACAQLEDARRGLEACEAKLHQPAVSGSIAADSPRDSPVRETTVREMTLRETKTVEHDAAAVARLTEENAAMKGQLERLWLDIDLAIQRNQDMVCWKL